ncbi:MAG: ATP-binding protein [Candidatus Edwardsbacteria bacterium]|nr:ATP-binding protein [Candidatus Edwardsbacteria bacterium]
MTERCWEVNDCNQPECAVRQRNECRCWLSEPRACFDGERRSLRDRLIRCCQRCLHFHQTIDRCTGRRSSEHVFCDTLFKALAEMDGCNAELAEINQALKQKIRSLSTLDHVSKALQSTLDQHQIFHIILTGITAAEILSLNRAFLFLVDGEKKTLEGAMGVGPPDPEEAGRIWGELEQSQRTFIDLALVPHAEIRGNDHVNKLVGRMRLPLDSRDNILTRAVLEKKSFLVADAGGDPATAGIGAHFSVNAFAVTPLVADDEALGLLMADNAITGLPVTEADLVLMGIFAGQAAAAIKNARLYARLQDKIRELAESQEQLLKAERMAAIGEVAATLAHEIRTPLVSIGGFLNSMISQQHSGHPHKKEFAIVQAEIERLEHVLSDTLEMARFRDPALARADIAGIIVNCLQLLAPECEAKGIRAALDIEPGLPAVWLDMRQFPQALLNILKNAIHAMPGGGAITITGKLARGRDLELTIADTGVGIPEPAIQHIFEQRYTTKKHGLGIGLAVSKKIVEGHRGTIRAFSREQQGTTFVINIPVRS